MWDDCINIYVYDENGSPVGFLHRYEMMADNTYLAYFYEKNMFGDIVAIYDTNGVKQVSYTYDAFGNSTRTIHASGTRAKENNLRYRGYYYDIETGLYYLNSRYYDPVTGRFINADGQMSGANGSLKGYNLFAYCFNNPVNMNDPTGHWPKWIEKTVKVLSVVVAATAAVVMVGAVSALTAGTGSVTAVYGATIFLGAAISGINGGVANEAKGNSYTNGYIGGAIGGAIQSTLSKTPARLIAGGSVGVSIGTAVTDLLNNLDPDSTNSTGKEIATNAITSGSKAFVTSSLTAYVSYASDLAAINGANGLMPTYTYAFGEAVKSFFGWLDDALVYIWE